MSRANRPATAGRISAAYVPVTHDQLAAALMTHGPNAAAIWKAIHGGRREYVLTLKKRRDGEWGISTRAPNGEVVEPSEGYTRKQDARRAALKTMAAPKVLVEERPAGANG